MSHYPLRIQRHEVYWTGDDEQIRPSGTGEYVRYTDHCEVVDIAIARASQQAYRTAVAECIAAVKALPLEDAHSGLTGVEVHANVLATLREVQP